MPRSTERQRPGLIGHSWTFGSQTTVSDAVSERQFSRLIKVLAFRYRSEGCRSGTKFFCYRHLKRWFWPRDRPGDTNVTVLAAGGNLEPGARNPDVAEEHQGFNSLEQNQR